MMGSETLLDPVREQQTVMGSGTLWGPVWEEPAEQTVMGSETLWDPLRE